MLNGAGGDDLIVALGGGGASTLTGGDGRDTYWLDSNVTEIMLDASASVNSDSAVHRVDAFQSLRGTAVSKDLNGQNLVDPTIKGSARYFNFAADRSSVTRARRSTTSNKAPLAIATSWPKSARSPR